MTDKAEIGRIGRSTPRIIGVDSPAGRAEGAESAEGRAQDGNGPAESPDDRTQDAFTRLHVHRLRVKASAGDYDVVIGSQLLAAADRFFEAVASADAAVLIIFDEALATAGYPETLRTALRRRFSSVHAVALPTGEASKSLKQAERLYAECLAAGLDRKSVIVSLGGGVAGDVAGFVAATFMRGIRFVQVPTTLLAHDASIGGKVAINLPQGKNLVGAFHPPRLVLYDVETLRTLPPAERSSGLAEAIKHGIIRDPGLFAFIAAHAEALLEGDPSLTAELLARSCQVKADIVSLDERESGLRAILNLGHTVGHAVEALAYGAYTHGAAVAMGMVCEARIAVRLGLAQSELVSTIQQILARVGLPNELPDSLKNAAAIDALIAHMRLDKKAIARSLPFVLPESLGSVRFIPAVSEQIVMEALAD